MLIIQPEEKLKTAQDDNYSIVLLNRKNANYSTGRLLKTTQDIFSFFSIKFFDFFLILNILISTINYTSTYIFF